MKLHRLFIAGVLLAAFLCVGGANAARHLASSIHVQAAKHKDGPWSDSDPDVNIKAGKAKDLFLRARNETMMPPHTASITLSQTSSGQSGYHFTWFAGHKNITNRVQGSGYDFNLKFHKTKKFRIHAKVTDDSNQDCVYGYFDGGMDGGSVRGFRINGNEICVI